MCKGSIADTYSGFERRKTSIEAGLLFLSVCYGGVYWLNPDIEPDAVYCNQVEEQEGGPCRRPDLIAYKVTSAICMLYMGLMGVYNWYFSRRMKELGRRGSPEDRLFGHLEAGELQNVAIFCYQVWDFCVSLTIPEHFEMIFLVHHFLAGLTAYFSLENGMVGYYAVFFGGCSEFSSIFLVFADLDQFFPPSPGSNYELFILACKALFTLSFAYFRVVCWWLVSKPLWSDSLRVLSTGVAEKKGPGKSFFLRVFLALNVLLGSLQVYWFVKIIQAVLEILG